MLVQKRLLFIAILLMPFLLPAQFPTAVGTKWEYFQLLDPDYYSQTQNAAFVDEVVGDTSAGGNTYQIVRRSGVVTYGSDFSWYSDTMDCSYYYRVLGTQVWALDSVVNGVAEESLLYEFGLSVGDTLAGRVKNLINLTPISQGDYLYCYDYDSIYPPNLGMDSAYVRDTAYGTPPWIPAAHAWRVHGDHNHYYLPGIGTLYSIAFVGVPEYWGQSYYLDRLTSNGQELYRNEGMAMALDAQEKNASLMAFPNPATNMVRIASKVPWETLCLVDASGKTVLSLSVTSQDQTLDVRHLPRGLYWLVAQGEKQAALSIILR